MAFFQDRFVDQGLLGDDCVRSIGRVHGFVVAEADGSSRRPKFRAHGCCRYEDANKNTRRGVAEFGGLVWTAATAHTNSITPVCTAARRSISFFRPRPSTYRSRQ